MPASYYSILEIKANKPYDVIRSILGSRDGNEVLPADTKFRIMQGKRATPMIFYHESISIIFFLKSLFNFYLNLSICQINAIQLKLKILMRLIM